MVGTVANYFSNFTGELYLVTSKSVEFIGPLLPRQPFVSLYSDNRTVITLSLTTSPYILSRIEKVRESKEIQLAAYISFVGQMSVRPQNKTPISAQIKFTIPKSDWVEKFLPILGFKTVSLIEVPQLINCEFNDTIDYLNDAWKQYSMGEYRKVFADCRNAIDCLTCLVKAKGFEKQETAQDGKNKPVPDWDKFFDNEELGDLIANINKKLFRLTSVGSHGSKRCVDREDADFALMISHAMVNLVVRKYENIEL
jgi:hypothetical protein